MTKTADDDLIRTPPAQGIADALGAGHPMSDITRAKFKRLSRQTGAPFDDRLTDRSARYRMALLEDVTTG